MTVSKRKKNVYKFDENVFKVCKKCMVLKNAVDLIPDKLAKYGVRALCRPCLRIHTRESMDRRFFEAYGYEYERW